MLWSLIKICLFVAIVAGLTFGAGQIMETGSALRIAFGGFEATIGPLQAVIVALVFLAAIWLLLRLVGLLVAVIRFCLGDDSAILRFWNRNRERKGFEALTEGLMALAAGEERQALARAARAERLLKRPEITGLLTAQAAEAMGDSRKAEETYKALLENPKTRFVGVRGLMKQKLAEGDTEKALKLAEKAFALKPAHGEVSDTLLRLQADASDWTGARKTLSAKLKHGSVPRDVHRRRDAVLAVSEAKDVLLEGNSIEAREAAIEANRLSPDLVPAAVMAARSYIEDKKPRYATRVVKKAWDVAPHPDLAAVFAEIEPDEAPAERIKRFHALTRLHPDHAETKMLLAELQIAAEDFPAARKAMGDLAEAKPSARALTLMAAIERGEGASEDVVRGWLTKALTAPRGEQWICDNCQHIHPAWIPVCESCGAFDSLAWRVPSSDGVAMPQSTGLLPLIVGPSEEPALAEPEMVEVSEPEVEAEVVEEAEATQVTPPASTVEISETRH